ncbi:MAG: carboxypeptidase-like regulatory domain-containing protein [Myxococcales bacterium]|nr:carboxypeptidase-like regulatory domain-containing protein [Myxococcales bacterium]
MRMLLLLVVPLAVAGIGCGNGGDVGGTGGTGGVDDALDLNIGPGEVRAGRLSASQLPADEDGLAVYEEGDFALVNEHVALIIEDEGFSELYFPFGGLIVGIARYRDGALVDRADYNELAIVLRRFLVAADDVSLINDGRDGNPAVVRAEGLLIAVPFLEDLLGGTLAGTILLGPPPPEDAEFQATRAQVDYELAPNAEHIDIYYTLDGDLTVAPVYAFFQSDRMAPYVPGQGFGVRDIDLEYPYVGWVDDDAVSYAAEDPSGPMTAVFAAASAFGFTNPAASGLLPLAGETVAFAAGEREHLMRVHIGGNGLEGLRQAIARTDGTSTRTIAGTVRNADGSPTEGVRVHAETADVAPSYLTRVTSAADGSYALEVPAGQDVQLRAFRRGDGITEPLVVDATTATADLQLPAKGTIRVVARDADSQDPLPVRVQVLPTAEGFQPPDNFGEPRVPFDGRLHVVFPSDGDVTLTAPLGNNRVVVSRGYEYDIVDSVVAVAMGEPAEVNANLRRVVNSTGVMCGDFHIRPSSKWPAIDPAIPKSSSSTPAKDRGAGGALTQSRAGPTSWASLR